MPLSNNLQTTALNLAHSFGSRMFDKNFAHEKRFLNYKKERVGQWLTQAQTSEREVITVDSFLLSRSDST